MEGWTAVAFALAAPGAGGLGSRLSKYLHPLAGRPLAWHTLQAVAHLAPPPRSVVLVGGPDLAPELFADLGVEVAVVAPEEAAAELAARLPAGLPVLAVDAAAPIVGSTLQGLVDAASPALLEDPQGRPLAAWLPAQSAAVLAGGMAAVREAVPASARRVDPDGFVVASRAEMARASVRIRDRLVRALMDAGATFLLPDTVLVDVDVRIGRDTVVYPNVVLEGETTIGEETVIGPGCRIVDSWVGSGVELKGFNYLSHTSIRNRAILEPHVRRGFD